MAIHETKYETKNGKTRKVKKDKNGAAGSTPGANKNQLTGETGKQGA